MSFFNVYQGKKVIVTGHTGFKGSWLAIWLVQLGADVYGYALPPTSEKDNFVTTKLNRFIHNQEGDIRDRKKLKEYFNQVQPDIAFHLAAQPLVRLSYEDPVGTFETNLLGVVNFFEAVRDTPSVKAALNITSDKCYNNNEWVWGYRENDPMGGKDPYSASKGCSELITASYQHSFFTDDTTCSVATARAGNVIGGGDWSDDRIVPDYFRSLISNQKLEIRNPHATRPWQHVLEPLSGYLHLAAMLFMHGKKFSGGWNFGPEDTSNYSVKELIDKLSALSSGGGYKISGKTDQLYEARLLKLDISKAVTQLKWKPVLTFEDTVLLTLNGYLDDLNKDEDVYRKRIAQIKFYTDKALHKEIEWSK